MRPQAMRWGGIKIVQNGVGTSLTSLDGPRASRPTEHYRNKAV